MDREAVAVITDIHGNLTALEAALARIERVPYDTVAVAAEVRAAGLPFELAGKLLSGT